MSAALAALPIAVVLAGMLGLGLGAAAAGAAGLAVAALVAVSAFGFGAGGLAAPALGVAAEAAFTTATILWIVLPALALYELQQRAGAFARLGAALDALTPDRGLQILLVAWFFGLFMEGAAGFGTPVALAAPLIAGLGVPPVRAVALALLGHAAGVSFGALGTPVLAQAAAAGLDADAVARSTAALHALLGGGLALLLGRLAGARALPALGAGAAFLLPALGLALLSGPELPTLGGALIGGLLFAAAIRRRGAARPAGLGRDLAPYLAILALVLATRLIGPVEALLRSLAIGWSLPGGFEGRVLPLHHPGTLLLLGTVGAAVATGRGHLLAPAFRAAAARLLPVAGALLAMLLLARLMVHSGQIAALAAAAAGAGAAWPLFAPMVGLLGSFVTGSATASNILFTGFQVGTAEALGLPPVLMAAGQGLGAAIGNAVAPHNVIAGAATLGLAGRDGAILARTALPALLYAAAGGVLLLLLTLAQGAPAGIGRLPRL